MGHARRYCESSGHGAGVWQLELDSGRVGPVRPSMSVDDSVDEKPLSDALARILVGSAGEIVAHLELMLLKLLSEEEELSRFVTTHERQKISLDKLNMIEKHIHSLRVVVCRIEVDDESIKFREHAAMMRTAFRLLDEAGGAGTSGFAWLEGGAVKPVRGNWEGGSGGKKHKA